MYPKRSESRVLARTIRSLAVIGLFAVCLQDLRASSPSTGQVTVVIGVQPYVELHPMAPGGITMTRVTYPTFFNGMQWTSTGALGIEVRTNCKATLRCASTVTLACADNGRSLEVDAGLQWLAVSGARPVLDGGVQYTCLDVLPGVYLGTGAPFLTATIKKVWTMNDGAGTYTGSVLVEIMAN